MDSTEITNISKEELILNWKYTYKILPGESITVSDNVAKAFKMRFGEKISGYNLPVLEVPAYRKQKSVVKRKPIPAILTPEEIIKEKEDREALRAKTKKAHEESLKKEKEIIAEEKIEKTKKVEERLAAIKESKKNK